MQSKSLLIAIAAFAVTATGAQAYIGTEQLNRAGFSENQIEAFSEARELRLKGEKEKARDVLLKAGVDQEKLENLRKVSHTSHQALRSAIENTDYEAFKKAIIGTPLADIINTEADFLYFKEAHDLRKAGDFSQAKVIFDELGVSDNNKRFDNRHRGQHHDWLELTIEQRDALRVAIQANDHETVKAILDEAGLGDKFMRH